MIKLPYSQIQTLVIRSKGSNTWDIRPILGLPHYPSLLGHIFWSTLSKDAQNIESVTGLPVKRY
jgi:hypothetical protein